VDRLAWRAPDCANGERLGYRLRHAVKALRRVTENRLNLAKVSGCAGLDERDVSGYAHAVHVSASICPASWVTLKGERLVGRTEIVECVQDEREGLEPRDVVLRLLDVGMNRCNLHGRIECTSRGSCYLCRASGRCSGNGNELVNTREGLTSAFECFTSFFLNKNCRFRLERSIVSKSSSVMSPNPVSTRFLTAPTR
jgi:hypothetical protein